MILYPESFAFSALSGFNSSAMKAKSGSMSLAFAIIFCKRFFGDDINKVPKTALTVGVDTVMQAREVVIIVNGYNKARALQKVIEEGVNHMWTVSVLQMHQKGIIVCDEDSTMELKVGTVKYFKDIEKDELMRFLD